MPPIVSWDPGGVNPPGKAIVDAVITTGDTVQWVWDQAPHTTEAAAGQLEFWDSGEPEDGIGDTVGDTFSHTFTQTGVFNDYCDIHGFDLGGGQVGGVFGLMSARALRIRRRCTSC